MYSKIESPKTNPHATASALQERERLIACRDLFFAYQSEFVLKEVNFEVFDGDFLAIIGPNGGGKTTLIKLLLGLLSPTRGDILYQDALKSKIGYVPQDTSLNSDFPIQVLDVVKMGFLKPRLLGCSISAQESQQVFEILEKLNIAHLAKKKIGELSGGQRQRVLIARALCGNPKVVVLDEPTSNIDSQTQKEIYELLKNFNQFHTIIVISHDISLLLGYASKVLSVNKEVVLHDVPRLELPFEGHVCEVDILNKIAGTTE